MDGVLTPQGLSSTSRTARRQKQSLDLGLKKAWPARGPLALALKMLTLNASLLYIDSINQNTI